MGENIDALYKMPEVERESASGIRPVSMVTALFSDRKIFLFGTIDEDMLYSITQQLMTLSADSGLIKLYINSPGGEANAGLAIYDQLQAVKAPVNIYCVGMAASMAAVLLAGGQKGRRFILPHSKVMIHEPLIAGGVGGSATSIQSTAASILKTKELANGLLAKHTGKTIEEIDKATDHDNFMTAEEAVAFGICDHIAADIY